MSENDAPAEETGRFLDALGAGMPTVVESSEGRYWTFPWNSQCGWADTSGEFELILADDENPAELRAWLNSQPSMVADMLEVIEENGLATLLYAGVMDSTVELDQVHSIGRFLTRLGESWRTGEVLVEAQRSEPFRRTHDPASGSPVNAWLVYGSASSMPEPEDIALQHVEAERGCYSWTWTVNKATRAGDLLLFYFTAPWSSLRFVARAASDAFFERVDPSHEREFRPTQWWAYVTPLVPMPAIPHAEVSELLEQPVLRGRSGKYCKPQGIERLRARIAQPVDFDTSTHLPIPVGVPELPPARSMTLAQWRNLADGVLYPEKVVETHVVEPLVRLLLNAKGDGCHLSGQHPIGRKRADYVLLRDDTPLCVLEAKVAVRRPKNGASWEGSPDFEQAANYARELHTRAALIDAGHIYLLSPDLTTVERVVDRHVVNEAELVEIRRSLGF